MRYPAQAVALPRYRLLMTTATRTSIDWVRLTLDGADITLSPSPDIGLRLTVDRVGYDGYLDPLTAGPPLGFSLSVDLIPLRPHEGYRCEALAREVAARLGIGSPVLREFALEAALNGDGLPYNRMEVPHLLACNELPVLDDDGSEFFVRVFTAKMLPDDGVAYMLRMVD